MAVKQSVFAIASLMVLGTIGPVLAQDSIPATNYYAAYYDGKYGSISDGYWGHHGKFFWYRDNGGQWHQDDGGHFKRDAATGFTMFHGSGASRQH